MPDDAGHHLSSRPAEHDGSVRTEPAALPRGRWLGRKLLPLVVVALVVAGAEGLLSAPVKLTASGPPHVMEILEENHSLQDIIGNSKAPYINSLATQYGLATNWNIGMGAAPLKGGQAALGTLRSA